MKLKKFVLVLLLFFIGTTITKADNIIEGVTSTVLDEYNEVLYGNYEQYYRVLGALSYYYNYSAGYVTFSDDSASALENAYKDAVEKFQPFSNMSTSEKINKLKEIYNSGVGAGNSLTTLARSMTDALNNYGLLIINDSNREIMNKYFAELIKYTSLPEMLNYTRLCLKNIANGEKLNNKYNTIIEQTRESYSSFCDYLAHHKGVNYYIKNILRIISFVALGLAIILGGVDFVGAILSKEDNALQKAFQKFVRRLIAAALVFLAYVIVQLFLGLVTSLPGVDVANTEICEELKIGAFNN